MEVVSKGVIASLRNLGYGRWATALVKIADARARATNGSIHWRIITKNGKDYPQAYYHWQENGKKRTKYIPKKLLGDIQEAEAAKRPVVEILQLLGVEVSPSKLLGDKQINPSNAALETSPSNDISSSKMRRNKGDSV